MKRETFILFSDVPLDDASLANHLRKNGLQAVIETSPDLLKKRSVRIDESRHDPNAFIDAISSLGYEPFVKTDTVYSDAELLSFPLLRIAASTIPVGDAGPEIGTRYDFKNGCSRCGSGAYQEAALILTGARAIGRKGLVQTYSGELLIPNELCMELLRNDFNDADFRPVMDASSGSTRPFMQLYPTFEMPELDPRTRGITRGRAPDGACKGCGRDQHCKTNESIDLVYSISALGANALPSMAKTYELWGKATLSSEATGLPHIAQPFILVKPEFLRALRKLRLSGCTFSPVRIL